MYAFAVSAAARLGGGEVDRGYISSGVCPRGSAPRLFDGNGCPALYLAPMEVLGDRQFRAAIATIGGMDEMVAEFIRVPDQGHARSLARRFVCDEVAPIPLVPQLMGASAPLLRDTARELFSRGAHRVDLNCGCPAKGVVNKGSGAGLLRSPPQLAAMVAAMRAAADDGSEAAGGGRWVSVKMRSGFDDSAHFAENLLAAARAGAHAITLHPRTRRQLYAGAADWALIADAKRRLPHVPIVGNGDITSAAAGARMLESTRCDALMVGRGAVMNPWIFHQLRAAIVGGCGAEIAPPTLDDALRFFEAYRRAGEALCTAAGGAAAAAARVGRLKMIVHYFFERNDALRRRKAALLRIEGASTELFFEALCDALHDGFEQNLPAERIHSLSPAGKI